MFWSNPFRILFQTKEQKSPKRAGARKHTQEKRHIHNLLFLYLFLWGPISLLPPSSSEPAPRTKNADEICDWSSSLRLQLRPPSFFARSACGRRRYTVTSSAAVRSPPDGRCRCYLRLRALLASTASIRCGFSQLLVALPSVAATAAIVFVVHSSCILRRCATTFLGPFIASFGVHVLCVFEPAHLSCRRFCFYECSAPSRRHRRRDAEHFFSLGRPMCWQAFTLPCMGKPDVFDLCTSLFCLVLCRALSVQSASVM